MVVKGKELEKQLPPAPDGGWGWVVCAGSFVCMVICDGMLFSFGILYLDLLDYFQGSSSKTAMIGSLFMGMSMMGGPIVSALVNIYGIRMVSMIGGICIFVSFSISSLAPSVEVLAVTYGFFGGLSVCMVYIPAILVCGFYFDERRGIANGLAASGSGVGVFIYSPLSNYLQQIYTWKGAVLILAAIALHTVVCGGLFRPIRLSKTTKNDSIDYNYPEEKEDTVCNPQKEMLLDKPKSRVSHGEKESKVNHQDFSFKQRFNLNDRFFNPQDVCQSFPELQPNVNPLTSSLNREKQHHSISNLFKTVKTSQTQELYLRPLEKRDIFYSGSVRRIHDIDQQIASLPEIEDSSRDQTASKTKSGGTDFLDSAYKVLGVKMLTNPVFALIVFYSLLWTTHSTFLTITPLYAVESGVDKSDAVFLISISGISNIFGRIVSGWIADKTNFSVVYVVAMALYLGGFDCFCLSISHTYTLFVIESAIFGFCMATWTSLRPIVIVELLGIDNLTNSMGLLALFQGMAFCIGPPLAGLILDETKSFVIPYVLAGFAFTLSGVICTFLPRFSAYWNKRRQSLEDMQCI